jgi:isopenicillin-N N-acyltransferase-like protein
MRHHITCSLSGSGRERGLAHGRQLADEIARLYDRYLGLGHGIAANSAEESALLRRAEAHWPAIVGWDADLADEIAAIAEGADVDLAKVLVLNCYDEFGLDAADGPSGHCTGVVVAPGAASSGHVLIGQNWDIPRWYEPCVVFHVAEAPGQPESFILSHPGIIGGPGMNRHIALCWMTVLPTDSSVGVPGSVLTRRALAMTTVDDAFAVVLGAPRASGQNLFLADAERALNIETSATAHHVTEVATTWAHSNHYRDPTLQALEVPGKPIWSSTSRLARMEALLSDRPGPIEPETVFEMLRDHDGFPSSICEHEEQGHDAETLASVVMSPHDGRLLVSFGPPCSTSPTRMTLQPSHSEVT